MAKETGKNTPVKDISGIGKVRAAQLAKLGIFTAEDLLYHFPRGYENRGFVKDIIDIENGEICSVDVFVSTYPANVNLKRGMTLTKFSCVDNTGKCNVTFFNQTFIKNMFEVGTHLRLYGKMEKKGRVVSISNPSYDFITEGVEPKKLFPVYPLTSGLTNKVMSKYISEAFNICFGAKSENPITDFVPLNIRKYFGLCDIKFALQSIHYPDSYENIIIAKNKIGFDRIFLYSLRMMMLGKSRKLETSLRFETPNRIKFLRQIPFSLTNAQTRTIDEIEKDMTGKTRMQRLVTGDVGSGKTICAMYALYVACENGCQGALMVPTEILANQHYEDIQGFFENLGYKTAILTSSTKTKERNEIIKGLAEGSIKVIVGTHSLLNEQIVFEKLGVVITDEQHRFGVDQRKRLSDKNENCHVLAMSATPIPRTLALVLYGDMDISAIDEMPPNRQKVKTYFIDESYNERLYGFIRKEVQSGSQAYIVCPAVEDTKEDVDSEETDNVIPFDSNDYLKTPRKSATSFAGELSEKVFPDLKVRFIHGKMNNKDKNDIMEAFGEGNIDILVSTTVIEVGVNVPNATIMIVEDAEYYGLSQLHQLRGRVGRGKKQSYCFLISNTDSEKAVERLKKLCSTNNGYEIAEYDLETRGPGDLVTYADEKVKQSGSGELQTILKFSNSKLLYDGRKAAELVLSSDPDLSKEENMQLNKKIRESEISGGLD